MLKPELPAELPAELPGGHPNPPGFVDQPKNLICTVFLLLFISREAYTQPLPCLTDTNIAALTFAMKCLTAVKEDLGVDRPLPSASDIGNYCKHHYSNPVSCPSGGGPTLLECICVSHLEVFV